MGDFNEFNPQIEGTRFKLLVHFNNRVTDADITNIRNVVEEVLFSASLEGKHVGNYRVLKSGDKVIIHLDFGSVIQNAYEAIDCILSALDNMDAVKKVDMINEYEKNESKSTTVFLVFIGCIFLVMGIIMIPISYNRINLRDEITVMVISENPIKVQYTYKGVEYTLPLYENASEFHKGDTLLFYVEPDNPTVLYYEETYLGSIILIGIGTVAIILTLWISRSSSMTAIK